MTCSRTEAKKWLKLNWLELCENGNLSYALKRYVKIYHRRPVGDVEASALREEASTDDYTKLKREWEKIAY